MKELVKKYWVIAVTLVFLVLAYFGVKFFNIDTLTGAGGFLPLPVFTFLIALVDGFNPCNLFVLTMLVSLMLSASHSRAKIYAVGYTFIAVVYLFYFMVMAAFMNILNFIQYTRVVTLIVAIIAIVAGLINCKELFFYRKWFTLMIQDNQIGPLKRRINSLAKLTKSGSFIALILSSITLAVFASLIELPCTAGFPIIYTEVLRNVNLSGIGYYLYIALYNLVYVLPLVFVITIMGYTFKGGQISKKVMGYIKYIGGAIMLLMGLYLLIKTTIGF